jgi:glc operon protein GlcG
MTLTLAEAKQIVEAALDHAGQHSARISICVCDENGRFIALNRMDGAVATTNRQAIGKALASASTGRSSEYMPSPGETAGRVSTVTGEGMPLSHRQGGLPIYRDGMLVGACGVSGADTGAINETCASAGIGAVAGLRSEL